MPNTAVPQLRLTDRAGNEVDIALVMSGNSYSVAISDMGGPTGQFGYEQFGIDTATTLAPPPGASQATIIIEGQPARYRTDGKAPTASSGMPVDIGGIYTFNGGELDSLQFIGQQPGSIVNVTWEG